MSPIIVFAFNRLDSLKTTIKALKFNPEAKDSDLYIFVDGPRPQKKDEAEKVSQVREYVKTITGFKSLNYVFSPLNKGLAPSIIEGVTNVINSYGKAIVVEDDLYVSKSFLRFMNQMLNTFENDERIFQISGFSTKIATHIEGDVYLNGRAQSWSWATWKDRWDTVDWEVKDFDILCGDRNKQKAFNSHGSDLFVMLRNHKRGIISSWYVRFCYEMHKQGKYTICPARSLVRNDGFNCEGTHCNNYNRYRIEFEEEHMREFILPPFLKPENNVLQDAIKYWSIRYRIYGKLMTFLNNFISTLNGRLRKGIRK
ncbi:MAG: glycosyl transferase [Muribaculaceae bacterium]|nr:glycosyl transferase [Muribaculaceae bacterium]